MMTIKMVDFEGCHDLLDFMDKSVNIPFKSNQRRYFCMNAVLSVSHLIICIFFYSANDFLFESVFNPANK